LWIAFWAKSFFVISLILAFWTLCTLGITTFFDGMQKSPGFKLAVQFAIKQDVSLLSLHIVKDISCMGDD
jgi:hypothetical protein